MDWKKIVTIFIIFVIGCGVGFGAGWVFITRGFVGELNDARTEVVELRNANQALRARNTAIRDIAERNLEQLDEYRRRVGELEDLIRRREEEFASEIGRVEDELQRTRESAIEANRVIESVGEGLSGIGREISDIIGAVRHIREQLQSYFEATSNLTE